MEPRSFSRGKLVIVSQLQLTRYRLQWSRDLLIAESYTCNPGSVASTQLQWSRDLLIAERVVLPFESLVDPGFNGAAIF